jgi:glutamine amidotransferase
LEECGADVVVATDPAAIKAADRLVLPGVGAFPEAMKNMRERGLAAALLERVADGRTPLLGICLGMQLLASKGTEFGDCHGLGLIEGTVHRLRPASKQERVPHMGWNELNRRGPTTLLDGVPEEKDFYFVHSYHLEPEDNAAVVATTPHGGGFVSLVRRDNVYGTQFHPEKSQRAGFTLLTNFLAV